jgi:tetratricopeptide (TPR) repeat protein
MGTATPQRLGDFEIVRELGRGGMGVVYEARQVSLNRKVALKVLSGGLGLTPKAVQRFHREAEAAARLHHTNIVPVYATGDQDGTHFYAMELIDGPSLDHVIKQLRQAKKQPEAAESASKQGSNPPNSPHLDATGPYVGESGPAKALTSSSLSSGSQYFDNVARMISDVADALGHAHQNGVIHRDIKPSNLLLSPAGRLSINDFGLARMLEQPGMTMTGEFVGTPAYMSPEQITAGRAPLNHRTDIYSLGATLYELLTFQRPFPGERRDEVIAQIMHKEPKSPRRINRAVPLDLETICMKAMEKDPDRRYQSAGELAEDLRRYVNRFAIAARRAGPVQRVVKWVRRRPALAGAVATAILAIVTVCFFAYRTQVAEQALRAEKLQSALDKALAAAMGGDLEKAESAIMDAEAHGATNAQMRMLRGLVAFYRGDYEHALVDLEEAVKLDPDSVAARGMLAIVYFGCGDWHRYYQMLPEIDALAPRTSEDYLFKGYAQHYVDLDKSLRNLDEAVKRSRSPLARVIRAKNYLYQAESRADLEAGKRALDDVQAGREYLPDNPFVLSMSLWAHAVAANLYDEAGQQERLLAMRTEADRDATALKRYDTLLFPFQALWVHFEQTQNEAEYFNLARRASENSSAPVIAYHYALALHRRAQVDDALQVLDRSKWRAFAGDYLHVWLLAERYPQDLSRARAAYEEMVKQYALTGDNSDSQQLLRLLGYKDEAVTLARSQRQKGSGSALSGNEFLKRELDYFCGELPETDLLKGLDRSRWMRCRAHYEIGLTRLADGDRAGAILHFRQAVNTRLILDYRCDWSRSFLARMEKDPTWPPWIPVKKDTPEP